MSIRKRTWESGGETKTAWICDYKSPHPKTGKPERHIRTFKTQREAKAWETDMRSEVKLGTHTADAASITVAEAGDLWIEQGELGQDGELPLERATLKQYREHLRLHIVPYLGAKTLNELNRSTVKGFTNTLSKAGRNSPMVRKIITSLGSLLAVAQDHGKVNRNAVRELSRDRKRRSARHKKKLKVGVDLPNKDEIRLILEHAQGRWRALIVTVVFTGLRASELRGLTWADVDLDKSEIQVSQRADRFNDIGSPKSPAAMRTIPLAPMVTNVLREWQMSCPKGQIDLVFPNGKGKVESLGNIYRRVLGPLQKAAGITDHPEHPKYGLHAFRHVAASLFIEQGFTPKKVQEILGHGSIQMTYDIYGHLFPSPEDDQAAMAQIQARLIG